MADIYRAAFEKLCKWRSVFAGWQLGTRANSDPECQAVRDHREATLLLRAECSGITRILLEKGLITQDELTRIFAEEALQLDDALERRFPGFKTTEYGVVIDPKTAAKTMQGWPT